MPETSDRPVTTREPEYIPHALVCEGWGASCHSLEPRCPTHETYVPGCNACRGDYIQRAIREKRRHEEDDEESDRD